MQPFSLRFDDPRKEIKQLTDTLSLLLLQRTSNYDDLISLRQEMAETQSKLQRMLDYETVRANSVHEMMNKLLNDALGWLDLFVNVASAHLS